MACPHCDALNRVTDIPDGAVGRCVLCGAVLITRRDGLAARVVGLALAATILLVVVVFFPFLELRAGSFVSRSSVIDITMSISDGIMLPLAVSVAVAVLVLPLTRLIALIYALTPLALGRTPWRGARAMLRLAERIRPWAMAEIFMVGVAVALVKLAGMATLSLGAAFWAFGAVVLVTAWKDRYLGRHTLWRDLDPRA